MFNIIQPSVEEIKQRIQEIKELDLSILDIDEIKNKLTLLFTGYALSTPIIRSGLELYRGIPYNQKPKSFSYLSYPPKELAKANRASREKEPAFYCATLENVPFFELGLKEGDKLVVSKWETTRKLLVNNIGYTDLNFKNLHSSRSNIDWGNYETHIQVGKERNIIIQNFLAEMFSQTIPINKTQLYKLTIAIAEKHYMGDMFAGLLYPTIPMKANADNFAIKPSIIDTGGLIFKDVYYIEITKVYEFKYDINRLDWANSISNDGEIEWKGRLPVWKLKENGEELKITVQDGKWVARDSNENILIPE